MQTRQQLYHTMQIVPAGRRAGAGSGSGSGAGAGPGPGAVETSTITPAKAEMCR